MKKPAAWQVRQVSYGVAAAVVGVLGVVGIIGEDQASTITDNITGLIAVVIGTITPVVASAKTHAGSDSTVTAADVAGTVGPVGAVGAPGRDGADATQDQVDRAVARMIGGTDTGRHHLNDAATGADLTGSSRPTSQGTGSVADYYRSRR